jgi:hypothetical protein
MTQPPEYDQVAEWLRAIDADAGFLKGLERGYHDIKYAADNGLTLERHVIEQWQFLADRALHALHGVDLQGKSPDEVAGAYHDKQIAAHALAQRALQQRIGALEDGNSGPPSRPAREAAGRGTSLEQLTSEDRQFERSVAAEELSHLFDGNVREEEAEAWWAGQAGRAAAQDTMAAGPLRQGRALTGEAATATNKAAAAQPVAALVPTVSQAGYARVMAEAGRRHHRRLSAQADQACGAARAAGWASKDANETARRAVHAASAAARHAFAASSSSWEIGWQDPRRAAMLAWHARHPAHGQPAEAAPAAESPATPTARAELGRLFRAAADLMEQAGIPGLDVSCSPGRNEITIRVPEDCGDIRSRVAVVDRLAAFIGGESAPVPSFGDGCDWISAAGRFAGHSVQVYTPSRPQPGKPPRPERAARQEGDLPQSVVRTAQTGFPVANPLAQPGQAAGESAIAPGAASVVAATEAPRGWRR